MKKSAYGYAPAAGWVRWLYPVARPRAPLRHTAPDSAPRATAPSFAPHWRATASSATRRCPPSPCPPSLAPCTAFALI